MAVDFIPRQDWAFLLWVKKLLAYLLLKLTAFNIPTEAATSIQTLFTAYETAYDAAQSQNRGKVDILNKNETRDALKKALRSFIKSYLTYNPAVSNTDKESMGLPLYSDKRTPVPAPSTIPELELDSSVIRQLTVYFRDAGSKRRGKPNHVHGVELRWALLDSPPTSEKDLTNSAFDTASPYTFTFDEQDRGKTLYICPRWENGKVEKGPWGEIYKGIIP